MRMFTNAAAAASIALPSFARGGLQATRTGLPSMMLRPSYLVIAVALVALAILAWLWTSRPSSVQAATAWGLPGVWQHDCEAPVGLDNPRYRYSIEDGKILLRRDFGGKAKDASGISDVETTSTGEIQYVVHFAQLGDSRQDRASRRNVLAKSPDGRIRTVANEDAGTGEESVVGGIRAEDRNPTPWMSRCRSQ
jgi:hypothetical protein